MPSFHILFTCFASLILISQSFSPLQSRLHPPTSIENNNPQKALQPRQDVSLDGSWRTLLEAVQTAAGDVVQTAYAPAHIDIPTVCPLWDSTCTGNRTEALLTFFNHTIVNLFADDCFLDDGHEFGGTGNLFALKCTSSLVPASSSSIRSKVKSWLRQPECSMAGQEAAAINSILGTDGECCVPCEVGGKNVDVYYWPSPEADTSCLSIIGNNVHPPLDGATTRCPRGTTTTSDCFTYWG